MTKKGGRQTARGGDVGTRGRGGEVPGGFFPSFIGAGGDTMAEGLSNLAGADAAAQSMGFPLGGNHGAAPSPELLAQMFGAGAGEAVLGPAAAATSPEDGVDKSRWHIIYPTYLDKKKSVAGGRRVSLGTAVQEPRVEEMKKICDHLQIPAAIEYWKRYPRDWLFSRGRLRVQLKNNADGSLYNPEVPNKEESLLKERSACVCAMLYEPFLSPNEKKILMRRMCELIPQLKSRGAAGTAPGGGATSSSSSGKKKKK